MIFKPWLQHKIKKAQKLNKGLRQSVPYKTANKFGVVFCNDEQSKIEAADKLMALLKMDGKSVKTLAYERNNTIKHLPYDTFSKSNVGFWGSFNGKQVLDFIAAEYDFLICLDEQPNDLIKSILANSRAKCRVGRYKENSESSFELLLEPGNRQQDWVDTIYQYLKIIA